MPHEATGPAAGRMSDAAHRAGAARVRWPEWGPVLAGLLLLYVPTFHSLATRLWVLDEQGHGPIILAVAAWLAWQRWPALDAAAGPRRPVLGGLLLVLGLTAYALGRSQQLDFLEAGSMLPVIGGTLLAMRGLAGLRAMLFPLFFLLFLVPLPHMLVQVLTTPLKAGVSYVAEQLLHAADYPIARSGVILSVGQYQLLVADACAGLSSIFTLEALSLVYLNLMRYTSTARNLWLALLAVPIAFVANVVRVLVLILVTYHFGDEVGQGFMHYAAGMTLFVVAVFLLFGVDRLLGRIPALAEPGR